MRSAIAICTLLLVGCCGSRTPTAPAYALSLLDSTTVEWQLGNDKIGGRYHIDHSGDPAHLYIVTMSIVSSNGKQFVVANTNRAALGKIKDNGWADIDDAIRSQIDWSTARIWCEVRIYDKSGDVIFHGVKESPAFPVAQSPTGTQAPP